MQPTLLKRERGQNVTKPYIIFDHDHISLFSDIYLFSFRGKMTRDKTEEHSTTSFQEDWMTDEKFEIWVRKVPDKPQKAYCVLCKKSIDIASGGATALSSHQAGKNHS